VGGVRHAEAALNTHALRKEVRRGARIAGFGLVTGTMLSALLGQEALTAPRHRDDVRAAWVGAWSTALLRLFGVRVRVQGRIPERGRPHLVVANHRSTADILILLRAFGGRMVSRGDLARWPLVGLAARSVGTVFVDRADAASRAGAVRAMKTQLAEGQTVIVFPEGTTFFGDEVRPFHSGGFVAAAHSRADIIPVGIAYASDSEAAFVNESFMAHLGRVAAAEPSDVVMNVGDPISVPAGARAADLRDAAQAEVQRLVHAARRLVDPDEAE
jgi:1-acyl-sn-glycerol-3-phosphate acyltransferase